MTTGANPTVRVFIAVHISMEAHQTLAGLMDRMAAAIPQGVRWVDPQGIHLTLKFLGDIDPSAAGQVIEAMRQSGQSSSPFNIQLSGLGMFPNPRQPRVLWAGVAGDLEALGALQEKMEEAVASLGLPREKRPFSPHLTIGRVRDGISSAARQRIGETLSAASLPSADPWPVKCVHLMQSDFTPRGAIYNSLGAQVLGAS